MHDLLCPQACWPLELPWTALPVVRKNQRVQSAINSIVCCTLGVTRLEARQGTQASELLPDNCTQPGTHLQDPLTQPTRPCGQVLPQCQQADYQHCSGCHNSHNDGGGRLVASRGAGQHGAVALPCALVALQNAGNSCVRMMVIIPSVSTDCKPVCLVTTGSKGAVNPQLGRECPAAGGQ